MLCGNRLRSKKFPTTIAVVTGLTSGLINLLSFALPSVAQTLAPCAPPAPGEFILLVTTPTTASENQLKQVLPPTVSIPICDYQGNRVSRMGGFRNFSMQMPGQNILPKPQDYRPLSPSPLVPLRLPLLPLLLDPFPPPGLALLPSP